VGAEGKHGLGQRILLGAADGARHSPMGLHQTRLLSLVASHELQRLLGIRDLGHGGLGEEAPALQLPFLLLLQELASHQPGVDEKVSTVTVKVEG
jgi:hypothetical protein